MGSTVARTLRIAAGIALLGVSAADAQSRARVVIPPLADSTRERINGEVSVPEEFVLSAFAGPPHVTYPTCLHAADAGVVFVCTDPNLLFGRERHLGRILRLVDDDGDGVADHYTVFADSLDAVRGITYDGESVYVMHAPTLTAYRDLDDDGVADEARVLVRGLGFGLDDRNGDHSSNGLRLGIDGWIYIAVGDYGFLEATGTDGIQAQLHAGGVLRVRPDGSELEIVARGTRNIYDLALDRELRIFARDNNNNGQGWNSRFHYLPDGADAGYPSRFRNFPEEIHPALADFGAGAATTTLWVEEATYPPSLRNTLLSADWALNRVYRHDLSPRGATFEITQEELLSVPNPVDLEVDPAGNLFVASLSGGSYDYAGEHVGFIARLRPRRAGPPPPGARTLADADLLAALHAPSAMRRLEAQREILSRGASPQAIEALRALLKNRSAPRGVRIGALFTLKQLAGAASHDALVSAAANSDLRAMALRALADRRGEMSGVPIALYEQALGDRDPFVRLQAVTGLARIAPDGAASHLMRAATDEDSTVAHVAENALAGLGPGTATLALDALDHGGAAERRTALRVLARLHHPAVVDGLAKRAARSSGDDPERRIGVLTALARLHHREGFWDGEWWGNQPSTEGPYYDPVGWAESPRIRSILASALQESTGEEMNALLASLEREGMIPRGAAALLVEVSRGAGRERDELVDLLVGGRDLGRAAVAALTELAAAHPDLREPITRMAVALPRSPRYLAPLLARAVEAGSLPVELRARALTSLARLPPTEQFSPVLSAHAAVIPELAGEPQLQQAWRRYAGDRARVEELDGFVALAREGGAQERVLAYAVLVQIASLERNPEEARARASTVLTDAWAEPDAAASLRQAIVLLGVEDRFTAEQAQPGQ